MKKIKLSKKEIHSAKNPNYTPDKISNYNLTSLEKIRRIKEQFGEISDEKLLIEYDKLNGAIFDLEGNRLKSGLFWDAKAKKPVVNIEPVKEEEKEFSGHDHTTEIHEDEVAKKIKTGKIKVKK